MTKRTWRKSTYSGAQGNDCVELSLGTSTTGIRDTKSRDGAVLWFSTGAVEAFLSAVKSGMLHGHQ
ncbi:DUF397 domain-containing protein [Goodfellowiella coeruleoviolacea]|uniref:DUF397 domain-containing protein n=1 Tax=Goodfellowiella coeruleoviolacea TaxID=334858 RepID=A0AAE3GKH8_9PSEU|nr:DUF397 domain-containing protein [Goodfellowiella coeruleoviolacea]MCP2169278.1 protein of unknown function (DUF397) [Goodfellowiella coeruleoviolacea]